MGGEASLEGITVREKGEQGGEGGIPHRPKLQKGM